MANKYIASIKNLKNQQLFIKKYGGRNNNGRITVRHKGGGHKNLYTKIQWKSYFDNNLFLFKEYDSKRNTLLIRTLSFNNNDQNALLFYKLNTSNDIILQNTNKYFMKPLYLYEVGDVLNNITNTNIKKPVFARSAGTFATLLKKQSFKNNYISIKLPSNKTRLIHRSQHASEGQVFAHELKTKRLYKAGQNRWKGIRPTVRGVAMNPIDHPHGGGEGKSSGGRPSVSPWGRLTKAVKTRKNKRTNNFVLPFYNNTTL